MQQLRNYDEAFGRFFARLAAAGIAFGRALGTLTAMNPYTGNTDVLSAALADSVGMNALHMVTADPQRTPTLVMFSHPDYFWFAAAANCNTPCITVPTTPPSSTFAWNHGGHPARDRDDVARNRRTGRAPPAR